MQKTGLVMEVRGKTAIVLTPDGQFCRTVANRDWEVGMTVEWREDVRRTSRVARVPAWQKSLAAASAACLALAAGLWVEVQHHNVPTAYAYVSLDINPSVEFTLSQSGRVLGAEGLDSDGQKLLTKFNPKGHSMQSAVKEMVDLAAQSQMLPQNDVILVTTAPGTSAGNVDKLSQEAQSDVQQAIAQNPQAAAQHPAVYSLSASASVWKVADRMNVSPGKLLAYLVANHSGHVLTMQDLYGNTLSQVLNKPDNKSVMAMIQDQSATELESLVSQIRQEQIVNVSDPGQTNPANTSSNQNQTQSKGTNNSSKGNGQGMAKGHQNNTNSPVGKIGSAGTHPLSNFANTVKNILNSTKWGSLSNTENKLANQIDNSLQNGTKTSGSGDTSGGTGGDQKKPGQLSGPVKPQVTGGSMLNNTMGTNNTTNTFNGTSPDYTNNTVSSDGGDSVDNSQKDGGN